MDFGLMTEGFVEQVGGRMVLRIPQVGGSDVYLDIQEELAKLHGKEVRLIVTPMDTIARLAKMVESGEVQV